MKKARLLKPSTDPTALARRAWLSLDGVTDEWLAGLKVEAVANAKRVQPLEPIAFAALFGEPGPFGCCCIAPARILPGESDGVLTWR
jgi:hypothetical protein